MVQFNGGDIIWGAYNYQQTLNMADGSFTGRFSS